MVKACIDPIAEWNKPNARLRRSGCSATDREAEPDRDGNVIDFKDTMKLTLST
jgi:hypothetical protein